MPRKALLITLSIAFLIVYALNVRVSTRQGVNYRLHTLRIPFYLKLLDFFDRHYNYSELVKRLTAGAKTNTGKAMELFSWTSRNIRHISEGLPVVDDHVWHIIIRGYGTDDQSSDVFATLCNYSGINAFYFPVHARADEETLILSAVRLNNKWFIFDTYHGVYFTAASGELIDVASIRSGAGWKTVSLNAAYEPEIDYGPYLANIEDIKDMALQRSSIQSPLRRLVFALRSMLKFEASN